MTHYFLRSLRRKVILFVLIALAALMSVFTVIEYRQRQADKQRQLVEISDRANQALLTNLRGEMLRSDFAGVQNLLDTSQALQDFRDIYILNPEGKVIYSAQRKNFGKTLDVQAQNCRVCHQAAAGSNSTPGSLPVNRLSFAQDGASVYSNMVSIRNDEACVQCHDPKQPVIGLMLTTLSTTALETAIARDLREDMLWQAAFILVSLLIIGLVLDGFVLRRLENLNRAIHDFGRWQVKPSIADSQPDEIGALLATFQSMADQIGTRTAENQELSEALQHQNEVRGELLKRLISAQESERTRVARELHDGLGQALTGLSLQTELLQKTVAGDPDSARMQIQHIQALIRETTECMHELILDLRPSVLDDLGLVPAVRMQAERTFSGIGLRYELDDRGLPGRLPPELETVLYRIYQEGINNIVRHARASHARLEFCSQDGVFQGKITDDGLGFEPQLPKNSVNAQHFGLVGMQERVLQVNGRIEIQSSPDAGTVISITIPISGTGHG
jgi:signal transduction histidine kinase